MFFVGLVPGIGPVIAFVGAALVGGSLLSLELTAYPLARVGVVTLDREARSLCADNAPSPWGSA